MASRSWPASTRWLIAFIAAYSRCFGALVFVATGLNDPSSEVAARGLIALARWLLAAALEGWGRGLLAVILRGSLSWSGARRRPSRLASLAPQDDAGPRTTRRSHLRMTIRHARSMDCRIKSGNDEEEAGECASIPGEN